MTTSERPESAGLRLDKWLWRARFFKTRSLAAKMCTGGHVRSGGAAVTKAHHQVRVGDVLTFAQGRYIRVVKVRALGTRRGPASEARTLYEDLKPPEASQAMAAMAAMPATPGARRPAGSGRPTKRERRSIDKLKSDTD